jgi:hypothetical protein
MNIQIFGHPYAPIGMGEQLASFSKALDSVYLSHKIYDIYGSSIENKQITRPWLMTKEIDDPNWGDIRIFHINGDEIIPCLKHLESKGFDFKKGKNIIIPAWELPIYPEVWREGINLFDEVWAISHFTEKIFKDDWVKPKVKYVGQAAERENGLLFPRKYFGIRDSSLVFLGFFDQSSYFARKNPFALIEFYKKLRKRFPYGDFQLVLKVKNINKESDLEIDQLDENIILINKNLSYDETTSLIDCCDIFVSLHKSEGFGRGAAEAILRGKRAIITNYSGVEDYSKDLAIIPVSYDLVDVREGEYPYYENQKWAEPNIDEAVAKASKIIEKWREGFTNAHFFEKYVEAGNVVRSVASNFAVGVNVIKNLMEGN